MHSDFLGSLGDRDPWALVDQSAEGLVVLADARGCGYGSLRRRSRHRTVEHLGLADRLGGASGRSPCEVARRLLKKLNG
ncbi:MAG: hypothetical protein WKF96_12655 [Solirubrobacteraceae bacterium]